MKPEIIKEEKDYIVVNKPAGLIVHSDGRSDEETLCDFLIQKYPEITEVGETLNLSDGQIIEKPGIVHRLDRETSGIMLVARTQSGFNFLKNKFKNREVTKTYHAFVYGNIKEDQMEIDEPIAKSKKDFRQWMSGDNVRGKLREATTIIKVLKRSKNKEATLIEALPKTGRTHQIRVHLKFINNPLVADSLYAPNRPALFGFERVALHSHKISFMDAENNKQEYEAEYPDDFKQAVENFN